MAAEALGWWGVPLGILAGTLRGSVPFLFVSLGECLTEKSGKINLGLEGTLLMGAMSAYAVWRLMRPKRANTTFATTLPNAKCTRSISHLMTSG